MAGATDSVAGKTVLITGAASGIGRAGALRFAELGARVVAVDVDGAGLSELEGACSGELLSIKADVTDETSVTSAFDTAVERFGALHCVWNNAGLESLGPVVGATPDDYRRIFDVNVLGVLLGVKHAAMRIADGGSIINTASVAGLSGIPMQVLYASSKAAVVSITRTAALELASRQIRVNCICPAIVDTPMIGKSLGGTASPELKERMGATSPFGRLLRPEEIAEVAVFLGGDAAAMISGQALAVDGAMTAGPRFDIDALVGG
jgi:NAD(P)-dependent dehydrogenase (short-subunit alcohol dehydrogenase family)